MRRSFLFLQGPHGPFFAMLGRELEGRGHRVGRVNFNGGDWKDWKGACAIRFSADLSRWNDFCRNLLRDGEVTDLVVYGDCRPVHRQAIRLAESLDIRVHVFEEGYIRPDWITLEEGGVNGYSGLPRNADFFLEAAREITEKSHSEVGPSLRPQIRHCIRYYAASVLLKPFFPAYRTHRPCHPIREAWHWLWRFPRLRLEQKRSRHIEDDLLTSRQPYFLVGLQISVDTQITCHSPFENMKEFLATVIDSFARKAPADTLLVIKNHPLDHGGIDYRSFIAARCSSLGLENRYLYLESGQLPELTKGAKGVVLVNSTVGTSVLFHRRPLIALGQSIYNFEGLTFQGGLDEFWDNPLPPRQEVYRAFRHYLLDKVLVNGGFYNPEAREHLLASVVPRLERAGRPPLAVSSKQQPAAIATEPLAARTGDTQHDVTSVPAPLSGHGELSPQIIL
jgi:capsular polysaccharide export protein